MRKILFVDDEPNVLNGLRRMLRGLRDEWDMQFAGSGAEALQIMEKQPIDVIVTDIRMPHMDGAQLLTEVMKHHPQTVRIALSGHSDKETILRAVKPAHQYLSKPCEAEHLKVTVARAFAIRDLMRDDLIKERVSQIDSLPSLPTLYFQIVDELQSEDCSVQKIGEIISKDPAMSAKILKIVNSSFFGLPRRVTDPVHAVKVLGLDTIKSLVLTVEVFSQFESSSQAAVQIESFWHHSLLTGTIAKEISRKSDFPLQIVDAAFIGGLLHDIGKLVLAVNMAEIYRSVADYANAQQCTLYDAELYRLGVSHAEVGAYLLGLWGLPNEVIDAVRYHHSPLNCENLTFSSLTAVHSANALSSPSGQEDATSSTAGGINLEYLTAVDAIDRLPEWREISKAQTEKERVV